MSDEPKTFSLNLSKIEEGIARLRKIQLALRSIILVAIVSIVLSLAFFLYQYIQLCEDYPELLESHQTHERKPVRAELDAFYDFKQHVEGKMPGQHLN